VVSGTCPDRTEGLSACQVDRAKSRAALDNLQQQAQGAMAVSMGAGVFESAVGRYGTPLIITGAGLPLTSPSGAASPLAAANQFMQAHADLFGLGGNDLLASTGVAPIGKNWHVARFAQTHDQVPVRGASVKVVLDDKNRVVAVGNSTIPGIGKSSTPTIDTVGAAAVLKAKYSSLANQTSNLLYVPTNDVCNPAALAHEVRFSAGDGQRVADVDAHSGVVLSDSLQIEHALTGLWKCNSASCDEFYEVVSSCSVLPCSQRSLTNTAPYYWMSVCTWMED